MSGKFSDCFVKRWSCRDDCRDFRCVGCLLYCIEGKRLLSQTEICENVFLPDFPEMALHRVVSGEQFQRLSDFFACACAFVGKEMFPLPERENRQISVQDWLVVRQNGIIELVDGREQNARILRERLH